METLTKNINPKSLFVKNHVSHLTLDVAFYKSEVTSKMVCQFMPKQQNETETIKAFLDMALRLGFELIVYDIGNHREVRLKANKA